MENNKISTETIEHLFIGVTIDEHLNNLHDMMIEWLSYDGGTRRKNILYSTVNSYNSLRLFLQNLKPIEKERN